MQPPKKFSICSGDSVKATTSIITIKIIDILAVDKNQMKFLRKQLFWTQLMLAVFLNIQNNKIISYF